MSIRISITSDVINEKTVVQKGTLKKFTFKEQTAWAYTSDINGTPHPHPEKITVSLPRGQDTAYPPGEYTLHPSSFYVGDFASLQMSPRLTPVKARS